MLNARLVNALISYFTPPSFCETFPVFGRIVRFLNPIKYTRNFRINHRAALARRQALPIIINALSRTMST